MARMKTYIVEVKAKFPPVGQQPGILEILAENA